MHVGPQFIKGMMGVVIRSKSNGNEAGSRSNKQKVVTETGPLQRQEQGRTNVIPYLDFFGLCSLVMADRNCQEGSKNDGAGCNLSLSQKDPLFVSRG